MDEKLLNKIKEDLEKSGFGSELKAIRIFENMNFLALASHDYYDKDEEKVREIDILGVLNITTKFKDNETKNFIFNSRVISAEVKKSEKPWIVFKSNYQNVRNIMFNNQLRSINCGEINYNMIHHEMEDKLSNDGHLLINGIHEAFKSPNNKSRWYSACLSATKSAVKIFEDNLEEDSGYYGNINSFSEILPLVILDGMLVSAELDEENKLKLEEVNYAQISVKLQTKNYKEGSYLVDIVTLNALEEYLKKIYDEQILINKTISKLKNFDEKKCDTWIDS